MIWRNKSLDWKDKQVEARVLDQLLPQEEPRLLFLQNQEEHMLDLLLYDPEEEVLQEQEEDQVLLEELLLLFLFHMPPQKEENKFMQFPGMADHRLISHHRRLVITLR